MSDNLELIGHLLMDDNYSLRLSSSTRWMVYDNTTNEWIIYEHKPYQKKVQRLYVGSSLRMALSYFEE